MLLQNAVISMSVKCDRKFEVETEPPARVYTKIQRLHLILFNIFLNSSSGSGVGPTTVVRVFTYRINDSISCITKTTSALPSPV